MSDDDFAPDCCWSVPASWVVADFDQTFRVASDGGRRVKQRDYLADGTMPVVDQGEGLIGGYTDDAGMAYEGPLPVIVFGDHTRRAKYVGFPFAVGADGVKLLRTTQLAHPRLMLYLLSVLPLPDRGYSRHFQYLRKSTFPLAPLHEQRRIVERIEELFSLLDAGVAALERVRANLKRYRASVLKAAVEGRLTEEWRAKHPDAEPASVLLQRILQGRRRKWEEDQLAKFAEKGQKPPAAWQTRYREPEPPNTADLPELPEGWAAVRMETLAQNDTDAIGAGPFGTIFKARDFRPQGVPIIFLRHVQPGRYLTTKPGFMDPLKWEELFRPYSVFGGELLVTKLGEPPGVCAIYPEGIGPAMVTPDVIRVSVNLDAADKRFLMHYLNSEAARRLSSGVAFGTTRLRVTLPIFRDLPVPLPPMAEQVEIVAEVERRLSVVDEIEAEVDAGLKRAARLRQAILKRAFEGRLVPQDPNDEPASVLLERIKAERATEAPSRRTRKKR